MASSPLSTLVETFRARYPSLKRTVGGVLPAARAVTLAALALQNPGPMLCLTASRAEADRLVDDLSELLPESAADAPFALLFPESEMSIFDQGESDPERLRVMHELLQRRPVIVVAPMLAFLQPVPAPKRLRRRSLHVGDKLDREKLVQTLLAWEYREADLVQDAGQLAKRGEKLDVYPSNGVPLRIHTQDDAIVALSTFNRDSQRCETDLEAFEIFPMVEPEGQEALVDYFSAEDLVVMVEEGELQVRLREMAAAADSGWKFSAYRDVEILADERPDDWKQLMEMLGKRPRVCLTQHAAKSSLELEPHSVFDGIDGFAKWAKEGPDQSTLVIVTQHPRRLRSLLERRGVTNFEVVDGVLSQGFRCGDTFDLISDRELFGTTGSRRYQVKPPPEGVFDFQEGDLVVHAERGIGRFLGLVPIELEGARRDLIKLEYANDHTLMVPPEQIGQLSAYRAGDVAEPNLSRLDTGAWQKTLAKARASVEATAEALRQRRTERKKRKAEPIGADRPEQEELEAAFPYDETPSQLAAIERIKSDMEQKSAMDRLLCGDVGYGKTEVALRAAFKAVSNGFQAAVLAPTTVLAQQHFESFRARMEPLDVPVSGLWSGSEKPEAVLAGLASGELKMVVGTHRLLSEDINLAQLGLLIIDEEQSFGVAHKERLRKLSKGVHVLSMSATPIPRTMQLALAGVRDISLLDAPPQARRPIRTYLLAEEKNLKAAALMRELERGGQAFVLHNRVEELPELAREVEKLVKGARVAVAHGQMESGKLEEALAQFESREHDILVCSTIIEAGIDFPNVNTIVIKNAHNFGLSQLYQIRGRVGRADRQAYCYLMVPKSEKLSDKARLRLETIGGMTGLGSGYQIALRDLEIRGAGDLLGGEQSGEIAGVGYALYAELLDLALSGGDRAVRSEGLRVDIPLDAHFPADYVPPISVRVALYRRLSEVAAQAELEALAEELQDRFGEPPAPVKALLELTRLRLLAAAKGINSVQFEEQFGERSAICKGPSEPLVLNGAPKGPKLLEFLLETLC